MPAPIATLRAWSRGSHRRRAVQSVRRAWSRSRNRALEWASGSGVVVHIVSRGAASGDLRNAHRRFCVRPRRRGYICSRFVPTLQWRVGREVRCVQILPTKERGYFFTCFTPRCKELRPTLLLWDVGTAASPRRVATQHIGLASPLTVSRLAVVCPARHTTELH